MAVTAPRQNPTNVWELIRSAHAAMLLGGAVAFIWAALSNRPPADRSC